MNAEQDNFENVRRLLALKRYERPAPGYFNDFAAQVIRRIEAGESLVSGSVEGAAKVSWLQRLWGAFETKPVLAGALSVSVCGVLLAGILYSEQIEPVQANFATISGETVMPQVASQPANSLFGQPMAYGLGSTGVVVTAGDQGGSILGQIQRAAVQPVSFNIRGSN